MHGRAQTRTHARTALARAQAHAQREDHRTARANTQPGVNAASTRRQRGGARAQIRTARICSWGSRAVPPSRVGANVGSGVGGRDGGGVGTADRMHARTHARISNIVRNRRMLWRTGIRNGSQCNCLFYLAVYVTADLRTNTRACIRTHPSTDPSIARTLAAAPVCVQGGARRGGGRGRTFEHVPRRRAVRSRPEHRRVCVGWPSRVGTRRWRGGDPCHGRHAHPARAAAPALVGFSRAGFMCCGGGAEVATLSGRSANRPIVALVRTGAHSWADARGERCRACRVRACVRGKDGTAGKAAALSPTTTASALSRRLPLVPACIVPLSTSLVPCWYRLPLVPPKGAVPAAAAGADRAAQWARPDRRSAWLSRSVYQILCTQYCENSHLWYTAVCSCRPPPRPSAAAAVVPAHLQFASAMPRRGGVRTAKACTRMRPRGLSCTRRGVLLSTHRRHFGYSECARGL